MHRAGLAPPKTILRARPWRNSLSRKLQRNDEILRFIEGRFRSMNREMPEVNVRQAMVPEGAEILENPRGTAPGLWLEDGGHFIVLLPGPPRELKPLFREQVLPRLERRASSVRMFHREIRVTGLGESHVEQRIMGIYKRFPDVATTILAAPGETQVHLRIWTDDAEHAKKTLDEIVSGFEIALTDRIFSQDGSPARGSDRGGVDHAQRHDFRGGKLHGRPAGAATDEHCGQLFVFSWRDGLL